MQITELALVLKLQYKVFYNVAVQCTPKMWLYNVHHNHQIMAGARGVSSVGPGA